MASVSPNPLLQADFQACADASHQGGFQQLQAGQALPPGYAYVIAPISTAGTAPQLPPQFQQQANQLQPMMVQPPAAPVQGVQNNASALPVPYANTQEQETDRQASHIAWAAYAAGWFLCCCVPILTPILWAAVAAVYYCKPYHQRLRAPQQRTPALVSLITCGIISLCAFLSLMMLMVAVAMGIDADFHLPNATKPEWPDAHGSPAFRNVMFTFGHLEKDGLSP